MFFSKSEINVDLHTACHVSPRLNMRFSPSIDLVYTTYVIITMRSGVMSVSNGRWSPFTCTRVRTPRSSKTQSISCKAICTKSKTWMARCKPCIVCDLSEFIFCFVSFFHFFSSCLRLLRFIACTKWMWLAIIFYDFAFISFFYISFRRHLRVTCAFLFSL